MPHINGTYRPPVYAPPVHSQAYYALAGMSYPTSYTAPLPVQTHAVVTNIAYKPTLAVQPIYVAPVYYSPYVAPKPVPYVPYVAPRPVATPVLGSTTIVPPGTPKTPAAVAAIYASYAQQERIAAPLPVQTVTVDPFKNLYTVQGWHQAEVQTGNKRLLDQAVRQVLNDGNGNFLTSAYHGTSYVPSGSSHAVNLTYTDTASNGTPIYTYVMGQTVASAVIATPVRSVGSPAALALAGNPTVTKTPATTTITAATLSLPSKAAFLYAGAYSAPVAATTTVGFTQQGNSELKLYNPPTFKAILADFGLHDDIILMGFHATMKAFANGTLTLTDAVHKVSDTLTVSGSYKATDFTMKDMPGGTMISFQNSTPH